MGVRLTGRLGALQAVGPLTPERGEGPPLATGPFRRDRCCARVGSVGKESLSERTSAAERDLQQQFDPAATFYEACRLAVLNIESAEAASLAIVRRRKRLSVEGATEQMAADADALQHELSEGPCLDTVWREPFASSDDLRADSRWPTWGPRAGDVTGARSALSLRLFVRQDTLGALNLYSRQYAAFSQVDREEAQTLAAHVAIAVSAALKIEGLERSLDSRSIIGQALGIAMERYDLDTSHAMALLVRLSSNESKKLRDVALSIIATRTIGTDQPRT